VISASLDDQIARASKRAGADHFPAQGEALEDMVNSSGV